MKVHTFQIFDFWAFSLFLLLFFSLLIMMEKQDIQRFKQAARHMSHVLQVATGALVANAPLIHSSHSFLTPSSFSPTQPHTLSGLLSFRHNSLPKLPMRSLRFPRTSTS
jgi:hypothetical protein